jgi:hypothetical protein
MGKFNDLYQTIMASKTKILTYTVYRCTSHSTPKKEIANHSIFFNQNNKNLYLCRRFRCATYADVAKLVDAPDLGSGAARRGGSSPFIRTKLRQRLSLPEFYF